MGDDRSKTDKDPALPEPSGAPAPVFDEPDKEPPPVVDAPQRNYEF